MNKIAAIIALALIPAIAHADGVKIAVVDMQKCVQSSAEGKKAKDELETAFTKRKKEFGEEETALKKAKEDFEKKKSALSESAQKEQGMKLQERFMKYQEAVQKAQMDIEKRQQEMSGPIIAKLREKVNEIAKNKGYNIVLEKNPSIVLFYDAKNDITEDVLKVAN